MDEPLFHLDYQKHDTFSTEDWIKAAWKFCIYYDIRLHLPIIHHPSSTITNDKPIMRSLADLNSFNKSSQQLINSVRIHLQVIFLSDLVQGNSNRTREKMFKGEKDLFMQSKQFWPMANPSKKAKRLWKNFLSQINYHDRTLLSPIFNPSYASSYLRTTTSKGENQSTLRIKNLDKTILCHRNGARKSRFIPH